MRIRPDEQLAGEFIRFSSEMMPTSWTRVVLSIVSVVGLEPSR